MKVGIIGAAGRMGRILIEATLANPNTTLTAAVDMPGSSLIGADAGELVGHDNVAVALVDDLAKVVNDADVFIDFTVPEATVKNLAVCRAAGTKLVIGTTGLDDAQTTQLREASGDIAICYAPNYSIGVNLCFKLLEAAAAVLGDDVDIEVIEAHHRHKIDAPSGTALMLGQAAADGRGVNLADVSDRGRDGITGARKRGDIGFTAIRGGDIVGEHDVLFAAAGERIVLRHIATDRTIFARGAIKAALWGLGQKPGQYDMLDVLGMK